MCGLGPLTHPARRLPCRPAVDLYPGLGDLLHGGLHGNCGTSWSPSGSGGFTPHRPGGTGRPSPRQSGSEASLRRTETTFPAVNRDPVCRLYPWMQDANDPAGNQHGWRRYELTEVQSSNRMDKFVRLQLSEEQEADFLAWVNGG